MVDPNDCLHVQIRLGTGLCQVVTQSGREILACRRRSDEGAIKSLRRFVEQIQKERVASAISKAMSGERY